jgi:hypothetical protein
MSVSSAPSSRKTPSELMTSEYNLEADVVRNIRQPVALAAQGLMRYLERHRSLAPS